MDLGQGEMQGSDAEYDAFQMYILGELPPDRTLVGDGQGMSKEVVELFAKADGKLRVSLVPRLEPIQCCWKKSFGTRPRRVSAWRDC